MGRAPLYNISKLAAEAGVSTATVSRVINNHPGVREELRCEVLDLLQKETDGLVRPPRPVHILTVVEIESPMVEGFLAGVLGGIAKYTLEHPIGIELCFLPRNLQKKNLLKLVRDKRCEAMIGVFLSEATKLQLSTLTKNRVPVVLVGERSDDATVGHVVSDSRGAAIRVMDYLASLGHRTIGMLANNIADSAELRSRLEGYKEGIRKNHLVDDDRLIIPHRPTATTHEAGYKQTIRLIKACPDVTAIFASTDEMAYGAIRACKDLDIAVPGQVSIVGFDDCEGSAYCVPALTTINASLMDLGFQAVKGLDGLVNGLLNSAPQVELAGELIERESCGRPPAAGHTQHVRAQQGAHP